jgi:hypothetical protein
MKLVLKFADGAAHAVHVYLPHLAEFWGGGGTAKNNGILVKWLKFAEFR